MQLTREDGNPAETRCTPCVAPGLVTKAEAVVTTLTERKLTIVTAESCTAGLLAAALSQAHGAAEVLQGGFVTYTKANKTKALGVPQDLLQRAGSVNEDVARHLCAGALERSPADIAIAVTGVLGPEPDEDGNPVGLVYICCGARGGAPRVLRKDFGRKDHDELRYTTAETALDLALHVARALTR